LHFSQNEQDRVSIKVYDLQRRLNMWREFSCAETHEYPLSLRTGDVELFSYGEVNKIDPFDPARAEPQVLLLPSGEVTPFKLSLYDDVDLIVSSAGYGEIAVEARDD